MYPKNYFEADADEMQLGRAFLVMPFDPKFDKVFAALSEVITGDQVCFNCLRADELFGGGHILNDVLREIAKAEIVLADVTDRNPNVFYELGIVHTVKPASNVILITQNLDDVPFDIKQYRCIQYATNEEGLKKLQTEIVNAFDQVAEDSFTIVGDNNKELVCERRFLGPDRCLYSFSMPELYLGVDVAKFRLRVVRKVIGEEEAQVDNSGWGMQVGETITIPGTGWRLQLERSDAKRATFRIAKGQQIPPREQIGWYGFRSTPSEGASRTGNQTSHNTLGVTLRPLRGLATAGREGYRSGRAVEIPALTWRSAPGLRKPRRRYLKQTGPDDDGRAGSTADGVTGERS